MEDDELQRIREEKLKDMENRILKKDQAGIPAKVIPVDQAGWDQLIRKNPFVVVDFWAEWCGPCRMVGPVIEELAREFSGKVRFAKCNTDQNQRLAGSFGISAIPTIMLFANGQMVDRIIGAYPKDAIKARISRAFGV
jgi:thioredoxin 1